MGIEVEYARLLPQQYQSLLNDADAAEEFFYGDDPEPSVVSIYSNDSPSLETRRLSIEKDWDMMHFLYTGRSSLEDEPLLTPLHHIVAGGEETPFQASYGMVRLLSPPQVQACAGALAALSEDELKRRFRARGERDIYPSGPAWDDDEEEYLIVAHRHLLLFFQAAARDGEIVLIKS